MFSLNILPVYIEATGPALWLHYQGVGAYDDRASGSGCACMTESWIWAWGELIHLSLGVFEGACMISAPYDPINVVMLYLMCIILYIIPELSVNMYTVCSVLGCDLIYRHLLTVLSAYSVPEMFFRVDIRCLMLSFKFYLWLKTKHCIACLLWHSIRMLVCSNAMLVNLNEVATTQGG
jgi:hypothetical protein